MTTEAMTLEAAREIVRELLGAAHAENETNAGFVAAIIARHMPPAAGSGWRLVPDRITDEQADAAWEAVRSDQFTYLRKNLSIHSVRLLIREIHRAMLAAAPPPPREGEK